MLTYRVGRVETVLPDDGSLLRTASGRDHVTLLTCTPTGVNTHRLLVRGERIAVDEGENAQIALEGSSAPTPFPWDALLMVIGGLGLAGAIARPRYAPVERGFS